MTMQPGWWTRERVIGVVACVAAVVGCVGTWLALRPATREPAATAYVPVVDAFHGQARADADERVRTAEERARTAEEMKIVQAARADAEARAHAAEERERAATKARADAEERERAATKARADAEERERAATKARADAEETVGAKGCQGCDFATQVEVTRRRVAQEH